VSLYLRIGQQSQLSLVSDFICQIGIEISYCERGRSPDRQLFCFLSCWIQLSKSGRTNSIITHEIFLLTARQLRGPSVNKTPTRVFLARSQLAGAMLPGALHRLIVPVVSMVPIAPDSYRDYHDRGTRRWLIDN
jgi:hypothetical protein